MAENETDLATETPEGSQDVLDQEPEGVAGREVELYKKEMTRLRQALARKDDQIQRALPIVQLMSKLQQTQGGSEILQKLEKGEPLSPAEEKKVEKAEGQKGLTLAEVEGLFAKREQEQLKTWQLLQAHEKAMAKLHRRAMKELPEFEELSESPEWAGTLDAVLKAVQNGTIEVPEDDGDFAIYKRTYEILTAGKEKKKVEKKVREEMGEMLAASSSASSRVTATEGEEIPEELKAIRKIGSFTRIGKSFSNPGSNKKAG